MKKCSTTLLFKILILISMFSLLGAAPIRIMPLGDSITYDTRSEDNKDIRPQGQREAYRSHLWYKLRDANISADFVGPKQSGQDIVPAFDPDNAGYSGETSHEIAQRTHALIQTFKPNIVLLHVGTNDHSKSIAGVESILQWIETYEGDNNVKIHVIVAAIIDRTIHDLYIEGFNKNLTELIKNRWEKGDKVTLIDMYSGAGLTNADYADRTHPNKAGYAKMAEVWFQAIKTPFIPYTSAPISKDDTVNTQTNSIVTVNVLANDTDSQNNIDKSSVNFVGGTDTDNDGDFDKLSISDEGVWTVDEQGIVTFTPSNGFTSDPTPIQYTVADTDAKASNPAKIIINYTNATLETFPTTLVGKEHIESVNINEASNSIEIITRIPDTGITF